MRRRVVGLTGILMGATMVASAFAAPQEYALDRMSLASSSLLAESQAISGI